MPSRYQIVHSGSIERVYDTITMQLIFSYNNKTGIFRIYKYSN